MLYYTKVAYGGGVLMHDRIHSVQLVPERRVFVIEGAGSRKSWHDGEPPSLHCPAPLASTRWDPCQELDDAGHASKVVARHLKRYREAGLNTL